LPHVPPGQVGARAQQLGGLAGEPLPVRVGGASGALEALTLRRVGAPAGGGGRPLELDQGDAGLAIGDPLEPRLLPEHEAPRLAAAVALAVAAEVGEV